ncbi:MAG: hypothetical protein NUW01_14265 [Gemmatimonadaceae bacterium]|nr:hypothetical protein [Gemmatimonadaceae bacterium]
MAKQVKRSSGKSPKMPPKMPPKTKMTHGMHMMPDGTMMSDAEHRRMMKGKKK